MGDIGERRAHYEVLPVRGLEFEPVPQPVPQPIRQPVRQPASRPGKAERRTDPPGER